MWFFTVKPPLTATSLQLPLLFVLADSLFVDSTKFKPLYNGRIGSLSSDVFEPRTSTGSEVFSLLTCLDDIKFVFLSFFTVIEAIWLKICAKPPSKNEKRPLPVDVRRSKTLSLKLPTLTQPVPQTACLWRSLFYLSSHHRGRIMISQNNALNSSGQRNKYDKCQS